MSSVSLFVLNRGVSSDQRYGHLDAKAAYWCMCEVSSQSMLMKPKTDCVISIAPFNFPACVSVFWLCYVETLIDFAQDDSALDNPDGPVNRQYSDCQAFGT